ncbi:MAG: DUF4446 family protein [Candidatus Paceibacterota bacterium]
MLEQEWLTYIIYILSVALAVVIVLFIRNEVRMKRLLRGKRNGSLESTLKGVEEDLKELVAFKNASLKRLDSAEEGLARSIQHVGVVRFNPFKGTSGSNQSFAIAFLNKKGDGVVVSSIYSRNQTSIFAKPIENQNSSYDLSEEEREAISEAQKNHNL